METKKKKRFREHKNYELTGEDIELLREQREKRKREKPKCDTHQDGA